MLRIAVCDDDEKQLMQTARLLQAYLQARPRSQWATGDISKRRCATDKGG